MNRATTTRVFAALVALYFVAHVGAQLPAVLDPYVSHAGMVNWYGVQRDAQPDWPGAEEQFFKRQTGLKGSSPGFNVVRAVMSLIGDPVPLGKAWAWVLVSATLVFLFDLARRLGGPVAALLACVLFLHLPGLPLTLSGIPHTYAWPILAAFLWCEAVGRARGAVVCAVLAGLFYPPLALLCCLLFVVRRTRREGRRLDLPLRHRGVWALAAAMAVTLALIFPWKMALSPQDDVTWLSYEGRFARDAAVERGDGLPPADMPPDEFELPFDSVLEIVAREMMDAAGQPLMASGASWLPFPWVWPSRLAPALAALLVLILAVIGGREFARPPRVVTELVLASLAMYLLAVVFALYLFVPDRYLLYSLPVAAVLYLAVLVSRAVDRLPQRVHVLAAPAVAALYLLGWGTGIERDSEWTQDFGAAAGVLRYLEDTPEHTLIAGPVVLMDAVELFADRETLVYCQEVLSTTDGIDGPAYTNLRTRVDAVHEAYFSDRLPDVMAFMEDFGVDLLVIDDRAFERERLEDVHGSCEVPQYLAEELVDQDVEFVLPRLADDVMEYVDDRGYRVLSREGLARQTREP